MSNKSFKDYIVEEDIQKNISPKTTNIKVTKPKPKTKKDENYVTTFKDEVLLKETKEEVYSKERQKLEEQIRSQLDVEYNSKLLEQTKIIKEQVMVGLLEEVNNNNKSLVESIILLLETTATLAEKVETLQTNLNITLPTPVIQLTVPEKKSKKVIHRDSNGNITHVTDEVEE